MPTTKVTNNVLADNAALNNLNAGASSVAANLAYHTFRMRSTVVGQVEMSVDGGAWTAVTMVSSSGNFIPFFYISTREAATKSIKIDFWSFVQYGANR